MSRRAALDEAAAIIARSVADLAYLVSLLERAGLRRLAEPPAPLRREPHLEREEILRMWREGEIR
jgi:hypothetical protein